MKKQIENEKDEIRLKFNIEREAKEETLKGSYDLIYPIMKYQ